MRHAKRAFGRGVHRTDILPRKKGGLCFFRSSSRTRRSGAWSCVGDSYFAHTKKKIGDFHSGSHIAFPKEPPRDLLDLTRRITDIKGFKSMELDVLVSRDGRPHVSELQSVWGWMQDEKHECPWGRLYAGRYKYNADQDDWVYEPGIFDENNCCNLRVACLVDQLSQRFASSNASP